MQQTWPVTMRVEERQVPLGSQLWSHSPSQSCSYLTTCFLDFCLVLPSLQPFYFEYSDRETVYKLSLTKDTGITKIKYGKAQWKLEPPMIMKHS